MANDNKLVTIGQIKGLVAKIKGCTDTHETDIVALKAADATMQAAIQGIQSSVATTQEVKAYLGIE